MKLLRIVIIGLSLTGCSNQPANKFVAMFNEIESQWEATGTKIYDFAEDIKAEKEAFIELANSPQVDVSPDIRENLGESQATKLDSLSNELRGYGRIFSRLSNGASVMVNDWEDKSKILHAVKQDIDNNNIMNQTEDNIKLLQETLASNQEKVTRWNDLMETAKEGYLNVAQQLIALIPVTNHNIEIE